MSQQRRFRNRAEREAIRVEITERAQETGAGQAEGFGEFAAVLDAFVEDDGGSRTFEGSVALPVVNARIEYSLPGRRIQKHVVRVVGEKPAATHAAVPYDGAARA